MKWTKKIPKVAGWYWRKCKIGLKPYMGFYDSEHIEAINKNKCNNCLWAGPIKEPK